LGKYEIRGCAATLSNFHDFDDIAKLLPNYRRDDEIVDHAVNIMLSGNMHNILIER
jgi:hypothetical protein